jgi:hypothetical protein
LKKEFTMKRTLTAALVLLALIVGCYYYPPPPGYYVTTPVGGFDRSWSAAVGAFRDQGIRITEENRGTGYLRGTLNGIEVTADVLTQADGRVRVEFNTAGEKGRDPGLIDRVLGSYNRRMGR